MYKKSLSALLFLLLLPFMGSAQSWEKLSQTPQMGWSSWNKFQGNIDEDIINILI